MSRNACLAMPFRGGGNQRGNGKPCWMILLLLASPACCCSCRVCPRRHQQRQQQRRGGICPGPAAVGSLCFAVAPSPPPFPGLNVRAAATRQLPPECRSPLPVFSTLSPETERHQAHYSLPGYPGARPRPAADDDFEACNIVSVRTVHPSAAPEAPPRPAASSPSIQRQVTGHRCREVICLCAPQCRGTESRCTVYVLVHSVYGT